MTSRKMSEKTKYEKGKEYAKLAQMKFLSQQQRKGARRDKKAVTAATPFRDFSPLTGITATCLSGFSDLTEINELIEHEIEKNDYVFKVTKMPSKRFHNQQLPPEYVHPFSTTNNKPL